MKMNGTKTPKQVIACKKMRDHAHTLLVGGSRSGKTEIIVRNIFLRAQFKPSRHLMLRLRFNHAVTALVNDSIPKCIDRWFPGADIHLNRTHWYYEVGTECGKESTIWIGGLDDKDRVEKVLGNEYSSTYVSECSQVDYNSILLLQTRLAETSGLKLRAYYDLNPCGKKHWTNQLFINGLCPIEMQPTKLDCAHLFMNPKDNIANLSPEYLATLEAMPLRMRQRFLEGIYLSDVEGALWTDQDVIDAKAKEVSEPVKTVVAVDPSVTNNKNSDSCGIVVASRTSGGDGIVHKDRTLKASTKTWAQTAVNAYYEFEAAYIVAEVNQGGDLVEDAIHNIDPRIKVVKVRAAKGKFARAEPIAQLYELGKIKHEDGLEDLETEMTEWVPHQTKESPNRIDALVWAFFDLLIVPAPSRFHIG